MNEAQEKIIKQVLVQLEKVKVVNEEQIENLVNAFRVINPISESESKEVIKDLHTRLAIRMDVGNCIREKNHMSWYYNSKKDIRNYFWNRYSHYLLVNKGFSPQVIHTIDNTTDEMMDLLGNPKQKDGFSRKGLVIGDVQSGKTSTYTALINKAADAGYKVIILLTGTIEKLRQQTQERLDDGFVGLDSTAFVREKSRVLVGVGDLDSQNPAPWSFTSTSSDFNTKIAAQLGTPLSGLRVPAIFVLKKNKSVLTKLTQWLKTYNARSGIIDAPMLMIDDEADNASVNTRKEEDSPTAINAAIRDLLALFSRSNYVAFTATPYANIFINPDSSNAMLQEDLFPRHFIYALDAPSNYIGASSIFNSDGQYNYMLENNDDCETFVPERHKKYFEPLFLPTSLKTALASFFVANVIRDLRGYTKTHRSMLINISRFINVQEKIKVLVDDYVRECQTEFMNYCMTGRKALKHENIQFVKDVYNKLFVQKNIPESIKEDLFDWDTIQKNLAQSCSSIVVRTVNGGNGQKNLNYDENEDGLRIIAIGGFSLSRGLTLEGLSTSYFYRNSRMYDTLMQMGRWFGYRNHYADLCRIWMSSTSSEWYEYITEAQEDLKREVKKMMNSGKTPEDFGLGVRNDINALLVTAINKMRTAKDINMSVSLCGTVSETSHFPLSPEINNHNKKVIYNWLNNLWKDGYRITDSKIVKQQRLKLNQNHPQILDIQKEYIIQLLSEYKESPYNINFRSEDIVQMIENDKDNILNNWDLIIAENKQNDLREICDYLKIGPIHRSYTINSQRKYVQMSGSKSRLGSVNYAKGGLTNEEVKIIEERARNNRTSDQKEKAFNQREYFNTGFKRNPLLIIYPVQLSINKENIIDQQLEKKIESYKNLCFGLGVGIPDIEGKGKIIYSYKINLVKYKELIGIDENDDFLEETGEEE